MVVTKLDDLKILIVIFMSSGIENFDMYELFLASPFWLPPELFCPAAGNAGVP